MPSQASGQTAVMLCAVAFAHKEKHCVESVFVAQPLLSA